MVHLSGSAHCLGSKVARGVSFALPGWSFRYPLLHWYGHHLRNYLRRWAITQLPLDKLQRRLASSVRYSHFRDSFIGAVCLFSVGALNASFLFFFWFWVVLYALGVFVAGVDPVDPNIVKHRQSDPCWWVLMGKAAGWGRCLHGHDLHCRCRPVSTWHILALHTGTVWPGWPVQLRDRFETWRMVGTWTMPCWLLWCACGHLQQAMAMVVTPALRISALGVPWSAVRSAVRQGSWWKEAGRQGPGDVRGVSLNFSCCWNIQFFIMSSC